MATWRKALREKTAAEVTSMSRNTVRRLAPFVLLSLPAVGPAQDNRPVWITERLSSVDVIHEGRKVRIERIQDNENIVDLAFALTSRPCPPYCIQPMHLAPGVETIGELELLSYLRRMSTGDESLIIIDSREPVWLREGMIPGAINIPWKTLHFGHADARQVAETLELQFGAVHQEGLWNFENAKTLLLYCNGPWCGQSPTNIKSLLSMGYPPHKLKWYRGGMQSWKGLGLTTVQGPTNPAHPGR